MTSWTGPGDVVFPGTMMDEPLLLKSIVERAGLMFGDQRVVGYTGEGPVERTYAELVTRVRKLASALVRSGVQVGDRVATVAWNTLEHLELFLAVPSIGAVLTPLNVRLHTDELTYILEHAQPKLVFAEESFTDRISADVIVLGEAYEKFLADGDPRFEFPRIPEESACTLCYTGGTTGLPKGVAYTHRSTVLHTLLESLPDYYAFSESDVTVPFVPIFHANAWGIPYASLMAGARLVMPGPFTAPQDMVRILAEQRATYSAGVPTIWHGVAQLPELPDLSSLRMVVAGGSPLSERFLTRFDELGVPVVQGFGMTEANPLVSIGSVPVRSTATGGDRMRIRLSQGRPVPFVEVRIDAEDGELQLRGATVTARYHGQTGGSDKFTADGWMRTGDVAEISAEGVVRIIDRTKDMIKSGGEWIPSVELEDAIAGHPAVAEAAVVAVDDDRWGERPAAFVVLRPGADLSADALREHLAPRVAKWWIPDVVRFGDGIPRTSLGKLDKKAVRLLVTAATEERKQP
ncbi:long-chain-fatty-acid--CoA ligase [Amycolatopsis jejuensis]|uniref:long-chain-fatty-acid--CoA ligase n=1 Tax=Amycolatopsis jejuensis TaxID=330084 RepID=UPI00068C7E52|nr:long-chain-fatty-acid--CoA ligase [Amycolatopsis jejuensis]